MKKTRLRIGLLLAVCLTAALSIATPGDAQGEKKGSDRIQTSSNAVEVVEVKTEPGKCEAGRDSSLLRLKVTSSEPIDVRVHYQTFRGTWSVKEVKGQKVGDEITETSCFPKAKFKVQTRTAGTGEWTKL